MSRPAPDESRPDEVDVWGTKWAKQRRIMLGIKDEQKRMQPRERVGKIRCTLGQVKEEAVGAGERSIRMGLNGHRDQDWPEVYDEFTLLVHRAYLTLPGRLKRVMDLHFVWREVPARAKARDLKVSLAQYWILVGNMKSHIYGVVAVTRGNMAAMVRDPSRRLEAG
jgi:hypothetical protein